MDKKSAEGEQAVRLVNYTDVYYRNEIRSDQDFMAATATYEQSVRFRVQAGDSIITKDSETPGDIAVPTYVADAASDMVSGYHLAIVRPMAQLHGKYLYWALASDFARQQFAVRANGMTRFGLTYDAIQSVRIHMPPLEEQRRIADFLDDQVTRIDAAVELRRLQRDAVHG
ncbi:MAG: restriction endonuclease subunit S, partial [Actinomycetales bacterium]|nr:restriction endonuclease subunit S [Actinomycetales bacterium]